MNNHFLNDVTSVDQYLNAMGDQLTGHVLKRFTPLQEIGHGHQALDQAIRKPFPGQADFILGGAKCLNKNKAFLGIGEMGSGKSLMGALIPYAHAKGKSYKALIMAPSHLTKKWPSEVLRTVPNARAFVIRKLDVVEEHAIKKGKEKETEVIATYSIRAIRKMKTDDAPMYFCLSKETAKLSYSWKPSYIKKQTVEVVKYWSRELQQEEVNLVRHELLTCPTCGATILDKDGDPAAHADLMKRKSKCVLCHENLWQGNYKGKKPRVAISEYILKKMRGVFDYLIADEVHELASGSSAQGNAFGQLVQACRKTVCLTGTLFGGYSKHLFYILYRMHGKMLKEDGFEYDDLNKFTISYGCQEQRVVLDSLDNRNSKGSSNGVITKEKPGLSPVIFGKYLLPISGFLELTDISDNLPDYQEEAIIIDPDQELKEGYQKLASELETKVNEARRDGQNLMGTMLSALMSYPDYPFLEEPICSPEGEVLCEPTVLDKSYSLSKENALVAYIREEIKHNRNVLVYTSFHGKRAPHSRIQKRLEKLNIRSEYLPSSIKPENRELWVEDQVANNGVKVIFTNPECVKTGLDLLMFPSIAFFQTTYNVLTLRQAARRSWRIGQELPVKVVFFAYKDTIQEMALALIGAKLSASMAIEGKFSEEGLQAMNDAEDVSTALARNIVSGMSQDLSASDIWQELSTKNKGTGVKVDGLVHDVEALVKLGYEKDKAELYLKRFKDPKDRKVALERLKRMIS